MVMNRKQTNEHEQRVCLHALTQHKSDNEYKLDLENNKYKLDSGTVEIEATYSSITSMKIIQYAFGGGDV